MARREERIRALRERRREPIVIHVHIVPGDAPSCAVCGGITMTQMGLRSWCVAGHEFPPPELRQ
jgi:hypothetical protein